ncbi:hypothetical protein [Floridanema evergladense]|uniref:Uncharacterized protein n=1 Tax=Floridaenema evergladense BLCC-F167 TaxID=3153639 RepID=A0ABV4WMM8_9CYAN
MGIFLTGSRESGLNCLTWAFIDRLNPNDVKIAATVLTYQLWLQALEIEALMIQTIKPR